MDYDLIVVKTLERVYKNYYYIIRGEKEIAQHQAKMPALCDSVFTYKVLSLLTVSQENQN